MYRAAVSSTICQNSIGIYDIIYLVLQDALSISTAIHNVLVLRFHDCLVQEIPWHDFQDLFQK